MLAMWWWLLWWDQDNDLQIAGCNLKREMAEMVICQRLLRRRPQKMLGCDRLTDADRQSHSHWLWRTGGRIMNRIPNNLQPPDAACRLVIFKVMCKERYLQCGELNLVPNCQNDKNVRTAWKQAPLEGNAAARYFTYHQRKSKLLTLFNTLLTLLTVFT